jgi:carbonic anhydrase
MLAQIMPSVKAVTEFVDNRNSSNKAFVQKVSDKNVELTIENIKSKSPLLAEMIESDEIAVVGAMYNVSSGEVKFFQ